MTPPHVEQSVSIGVASTQSAAFNVGTRFVRLHPSAHCHVLFGANPTATTDKMMMQANTEEIFEVTAGEKVAVIAAE